MLPKLIGIYGFVDASFDVVRDQLVLAQACECKCWYRCQFDTSVATIVVSVARVLLNFFSQNVHIDINTWSRKALR